MNHQMDIELFKQMGEEWKKRFANERINKILTIEASGIGIGFTQVPEIFHIFPQLVQTIFAENCVAVVFLVAIILNLVLPKNMDAIS
ncbi:MAG: hypothetical protein PUF50_07230 [Erysipelotrichaceae bacterium]|nr:hypothetical protein [Erysipelotrichaceae bacterium]